MILLFDLVVGFLENLIDIVNFIFKFMILLLYIIFLHQSL
jgi:hypothetical protein